MVGPAKAGGAAAIAMTAIGAAAVVWNVAAGVASSRGNLQSIETPRKSRWIPAAFRILLAPPMAGKTPPVCWTSGGRFAKRRPLAKAFRAGSGRIAQLVEQMTLNHRVPGSSPGAPTKLFKHLAA